MSEEKKKELEQEYIKVKTEIKSRITVIKAYAENIQQNRTAIDELSKKLDSLQQQYIELEGEKKDESHRQEED